MTKLTAKNQSLKINTDHAELSATLNLPDKPHATLLLAHGAGADHLHNHMQSLAEAFAAQNIAVLRFNFPFKEAGRARVDSKPISIDCIAAATAILKSRFDLPIFVGGHSFGGRMATHAVAEQVVECSGMVLCSYPLHPSGKPATDRAAHFASIKPPVLFLSGTRDALADSELLESQMVALAAPTLHWLETADHSFKILKRTRTNTVDVYTEAATVAAKFITSNIGK